VRTAPNTLSFINERAWVDIHGSKSGQEQLQKSVRIFKGPLNIMTAPDKEHARMRRALSHAFSEKTVCILAQRLWND
jgi:cytochrome P450